MTAFASSGWRLGGYRICFKHALAAGKHGTGEKFLLGGGLLYYPGFFSCIATSLDDPPSQRNRLGQIAWKPGVKQYTALFFSLTRSPKMPRHPAPVTLSQADTRKQSPAASAHDDSAKGGPSAVVYPNNRIWQLLPARPLRPPHKVTLKLCHSPQAPGALRTACPRPVGGLRILSPRVPGWRRAWAGGEVGTHPTPSFSVEPGGSPQCGSHVGGAVTCPGSGEGRCPCALRMHRLALGFRNGWGGHCDEGARMVTFLPRPGSYVMSFPFRSPRTPRHLEAFLLGNGVFGLAGRLFPCTRTEVIVWKGRGALRPHPPSLLPS